MYVLGINAVFHESAACLLRDGELVAMVEEERFNRIKHAKKPRIDNPDEMPTQAIRHCLTRAGVELGDVDFIGYSSDPMREMDAANPPVMWSAEFNASIRRVPQRLAAMGFRGSFRWIDHHVAHAASAFYPSPFEDAAILTIDGIGDDNTTSSFRGDRNKLTFVQDVKVPHSIGFLWELISMYLGFDIYDATKIMGLTAYGDPKRYLNEVRRLIHPVADGKFETDARTLQFWQLDYLTPSGYFQGLEKLFGIPRRQPGEELTQAHKDIAGALQVVTDEVVLHMVKHLHTVTGSRNLCLAGGVALNCVTNQHVFEKGPFEQLFVQPAANDAGTALGAAWYIWHHLEGNEQRHPMNHAYWGPSYSNREIEHALQDHQLVYTRADAVETTTAGLLAEGHIVAIFHGSMEIGPRALGNRSLLADPRNPHMRDILNVKVKHREFFRPFAPSVLAEHAATWFDIGKETTANEFMLMAYPIRDDHRGQVPAVTHADGTSRIQSVRKEVNPRYHQLISEFHRLTGVPMVLNTSFNDSEPIVCTPQDAIQTFLKTDIDYLVLDDFVISKAENIDSVRWWRQKTVPAVHGMIHRLLRRNRVTQIHQYQILTDHLDCPREDGVLPLFPEHQVFLDEMVRDKVKGAKVLAIGLGSGVLSIAAMKAGARSVVALEGNARARMLTSFNCVLNGCLDSIEMLPGDDLALLGDRQFDYIVSNVPFVPGEISTSVATVGLYGLRTAEMILRKLDAHLTPEGHAQLVTFAPGDEKGPRSLLDLARLHLPGTTTVKVNSDNSSFDEYLDSMQSSGFLTKARRAALRRITAADGMTRLHLCVIHYEKGPRKVLLEPTREVYRDWIMPLPDLANIEIAPSGKSGAAKA